MKTGFSPLYLLLLALGVVLLITLVQLGLINVVLAKLGLSPVGALLLMLGFLAGSLINIPLWSMAPGATPDGALQGATLVALNVGGGLLPVVFSVYLVAISELAIATVLAAVSLVTVLCYFTSRPVPGLGISMPMLIAPLGAALTALLLSPGNSAPLAYVCGTLGVLIGADLLHLRDIRRLGAPIAAIGGAGTFDGIFMTGIIAVLLA